MSVRDTTPDALAAQTAVYRRWTGAQRIDAAVRMSLTARAISLAAIRNRHPEYTDEQARLALFRLLLGDELFLRAWPHAAQITP